MENDIDVRGWMAALGERLREEFGERLLFLGLQGSRRRGEAGPDSDIDAVVILDRLDLADLAAYRRIVLGLPHSDKACGFIGGRRELWDWPRHELFQFVQDTESYHGRLEDFAPPVTRADIEEGVAIGASAIYHAVCHLYVHGPEDGRDEMLRGLYKGCFFILQAVQHLRDGGYCGNKRELLAKLDGDDRVILAASMDWEGGRAGRTADPDLPFGLLLRWSAALLERKK